MIVGGDEPEAPKPPIVRHELFRNEEARLYLDVNPGVGFAIVVAAQWPCKEQPWLNFYEMRKVIFQMKEITTQQIMKEMNEVFWDAANST